MNELSRVEGYSRQRRTLEIERASSERCTRAGAAASSAGSESFAASPACSESCAAAASDMFSFVVCRGLVGLFGELRRRCCKFEL